MLPKTKDALDLICNDNLFKKYDIRFVGGTALSYIINHRLSEDLDFAALELNIEDINAMMTSYGAEKLPHDDAMADDVTNEGDDINDSYMKFMLNDVKVEFFTPPFNMLELSVWRNDKYTQYNNSNLRVSSLSTIIYMKTMAFWNRKKSRDLFDIHFILKNKHIKTDEFINNYLKYNLQYNVEDLYKKIQGTSEFYEKPTDEGLYSLVENANTYEWYRIQIENFIYEVYLAQIYS